MAEENFYSPLEDYFDSLDAVNPEDFPDDRHPSDIITPVFKVDIPDELFQGLIDPITKRPITPDNYRQYREQYARDFSLHIGKGIYLRTKYRKTPKASFQFMPLMIGSQGCGKGTWIRGLVPICLNAIADGVDLSKSVADLLEQCQSGAIAECGEFAGYSRSDREKLKSFIGGENTVARPAYGRDHIKYDRHFVIIVTSNEEHCLAKDATGQRRFPIIALDFKDGWTEEIVKKQMIPTMEKLHKEFWGIVKYLVETKEQDTGYEHWNAVSNDLRLRLVERHERRQYTLERALDELMTPPIGDYDKTPKLTYDEIKTGIFLDVPPQSTDNSLMKLLAGNRATAIYPKQTIEDKIKHWGYSERRFPVRGTRLQRKKRIPPRITETTTVDDLDLRLALNSSRSGVASESYEGRISPSPNVDSSSLNVDSPAFQHQKTASNKQDEQDNYADNEIVRQDAESEVNMESQHDDYPEIDE